MITDSLIDVGTKIVCDGDGNQLQRNVANQRNILTMALLDVDWK